MFATGGSESLKVGAGWGWLQKLEKVKQVKVFRNLVNTAKASKAGKLAGKGRALGSSKKYLEAINANEKAKEILTGIGGVAFDTGMFLPRVGGRILKALDDPELFPAIFDLVKSGLKGGAKKIDESWLGNLLKSADSDADILAQLRTATAAPASEAAVTASRGAAATTGRGAAGIHVPFSGSLPGAALDATKSVGTFIKNVTMPFHSPKRAWRGALNWMQEGMDAARLDLPRGGLEAAVKATEDIVTAPRAGMPGTTAGERLLANISEGSGFGAKLDDIGSLLAETGSGADEATRWAQIRLDDFLENAYKASDNVSIEQARKFLTELEPVHRNKLLNPPGHASRPRPSTRPSTAVHGASAPGGVPIDLTAPPGAGRPFTPQPKTAPAPVKPKTAPAPVKPKTAPATVKPKTAPAPKPKTTPATVKPKTKPAPAPVRSTAADKTLDASQQWLVSEQAMEMMRLVNTGDPVDARTALEMLRTNVKDTGLFKSMGAQLQTNYKRAAKSFVPVKQGRSVDSLVTNARQVRDNASGISKSQVEADVLQLYSRLGAAKGGWLDNPVLQSQFTIRELETLAKELNSAGMGKQAGFFNDLVTKIKNTRAKPTTAPPVKPKTAALPDEAFTMIDETKALIPERSGGGKFFLRDPKTFNRVEYNSLAEAQAALEEGRAVFQMKTHGRTTDLANRAPEHLLEAGRSSDDTAQFLQAMKESGDPDWRKFENAVRNASVGREYRAPVAHQFHGKPGQEMLKEIEGSLQGGGKNDFIKFTQDFEKTFAGGGSLKGERLTHGDEVTRITDYLKRVIESDPTLGLGVNEADLLVGFARKYRLPPYHTRGSFETGIPSNILPEGFEGFAAGGWIGGRSGVDKNLIAVSRGEVVLNAPQQAAIAGMAGGTVGGTFSAAGVPGFGGNAANTSGAAQSGMRAGAGAQADAHSARIRFNQWKASGSTLNFEDWQKQQHQQASLLRAPKPQQAPAQPAAMMPPGPPLKPPTRRSSIAPRRSSTASETKFQVGMGAGEQGVHATISGQNAVRQRKGESNRKFQQRERAREHRNEQLKFGLASPKTDRERTMLGLTGQGGATTSQRREEYQKKFRAARQGGLSAEEAKMQAMGTGKSQKVGWPGANGPGAGVGASGQTPAGGQGQQGQAGGQKMPDIAAFNQAMSALVENVGTIGQSIASTVEKLSGFTMQHEHNHSGTINIGGVDAAKQAISDAIKTDIVDYVKEQIAGLTINTNQNGQSTVSNGGPTQNSTG